MLAHAVEQLKGLPSPNGITDISLDITLSIEEKEKADLRLCSALDSILSNEEKFPSFCRLKVSRSLCLYPFVALHSRRMLRYIARSNWGRDQPEMRSPGTIKEKER